MEFVFHKIMLNCFTYVPVLQGVIVEMFIYFFMTWSKTDLIPIYVSPRDTAYSFLILVQNWSHCCSIFFHPAPSTLKFFNS